MKTQTTEKIGVREDRRTGQFIPTVNGKDVSPTSFDQERALDIARQTAEQEPPQPAAAHTPEGRAPLCWLVVNPDGKLLAVLDSESEAHWFTRNRGHASGAVYFKTPYDYAAAPDLLTALQSCVAQMEVVFEKDLHPTQRNPFTNALLGARIAIARATS